MSQKSLNVTWHDHLQHLSGLFQDLYENKKLVDVTLYCSGGSLKAHKFVLSSCSPYFSKIFQEIDFQHPVIILKGISLSQMHQLLEFMYKGSINILENELDSLIQAGSYLEIKGMDVKNIPSNMKNATKRLAASPIEEVSETPKRIKEEREREEHYIPPTVQKDAEQNKKVAQQNKKNAEQNEKVEEQNNKDAEQNEKHTEQNKNDAEKNINDGEKNINDAEQNKNELNSQESDKNTDSPNKDQPIESTPIKTEPTHGRQTRFKGQKRVDVTMFTKKAKMYEDLLPPSPKHTKKNSEKAKSSPINIKKEKLDDSKPKIKTYGPSTSKHNLDTSGKPKLNNSKSNTQEDSLSKIVIKDVFSAEDAKTSTPINKSKQKLGKKDVSMTEGEKEYIPVIPDIVMNEGSDAEVPADDSHEFDDDDDDDANDEDANGYGDDDPDPETDMLKVSHLECSQCRKIFKTDEEFTEHMKTHKKSLKCDYCDSYFRRMSHLIRHRRTHTGEKPYSCRECGKCFSRQDKLKAHIRVHDENEYKPPAHLKKLYEPPIPYYDEKRGRGRPRKNPFPCLPIGMGDETHTYNSDHNAHSENKPVEKRPRGEHVENYDITNLPFGDFSYLTSSLPDFSDLTIIPVSYVSKSETEVTSSSSINKQKVEIGETEIHPKIANENEQISSLTETQKENLKMISTGKLTQGKDFSIIKVADKDKEEGKDKISSTNEVTIINLNNEGKKEQKSPIFGSAKQLGECTIEAVGVPK